MSGAGRLIASHPRLAMTACVALLAASLWPAANAGYMLAKAGLAQQLIARAWQRDETARPWPWADTHPVAQLKIDRLAYQAWVLNGASGRTLAFGPGLAQGSAAPGEPGTTIIAGHRDSHFTVLEDVRIGDHIQLQSSDRRWRRYRIENLSVADSRRDAISLQADDNRLVLITCYPFDAVRAGGPLRYVVEAVPVSADSPPPTAPLS